MNATAKLYHPRGVEVSVPIVGENSAELIEAVNGLVAAGWLAQAPTRILKEGKHDIGYVMHRMHRNSRDGSDTSIIDLYPANDFLKWKALSVYLNNDQDCQTFSSVSGMDLNRIEVFPGTTAPKRGAGTQSDRYIYPVGKPFAVVFSDNPRYDSEEATKCAQKNPPEVYKVAQHIFVRWEEASQQAQQGQQSRQQPQQHNNRQQPNQGNQTRQQPQGGSQQRQPDLVAEEQRFRDLAAAKGWSYEGAIKEINTKDNQRYAINVPYATARVNIIKFANWLKEQPDSRLPDSDSDSDSDTSQIPF